ncbi:unnamed protein product [Hydatigera taeniaeformis]|uniref:Uncharacterized protein n=1 Tax=Hydatigena taeniaeformis TaxID=6205 RepID=A0A3P7F5U2_HYDTA|nr:unnamed protein product [Hydatigera taeniaeformis]
MAASGDSLNMENDSFLDLLINLQGARMNDQRADFPGLIRTTSMPNSPSTNAASNTDTTVAVSTTTTVHRNTSSSTVGETTSLMTGAGGGVNLAARMRSASDGLAEVDQTPSVADELAPGDDFFDMIFRLQQKTRINDQRSVLPAALQTQNHHHRTNYRNRHQDCNSSNNNNEDATTAGCHDGGGGGVTPHRLLRVLSVPGGKRRRRGGGGTGNSGNSSSKAAVA